MSTITANRSPGSDTSKRRLRGNAHQALLTIASVQLAFDRPTRA